MSNNYIKIFSSTLILITIFSCSKPNSSFFDKILKTDKNDFRGIKIGETITQVKSKENKAYLLDDLDGYLLYDYAIDSSNSYTVTYDFSENSLYAIELSVYLEKIKDAPLLFKDFKIYFDEKYQQGKLDEDGYHTWITSSNNNKISFSMKEDSGDYGFLSIRIRNVDY